MVCRYCMGMMSPPLAAAGGGDSVGPIHSAARPGVDSRSAGGWRGDGRRHSPCERFGALAEDREVVGVRIDPLALPSGDLAHDPDLLQDRDRVTDRGRRKPDVLRDRGYARQGARLEQLVHPERSEEHTSDLQSLMRISYA